MKTQLYAFVIVLVILCMPQFVAAGILKGKVTDTKGEPLPFATVYVQGSTIGTTTNADAEYQLSLVPGSYKVLCQYMGFKVNSFNVTIKGDEAVTHNFSLQEQTLEMKDVVVKANAEDPAYAIIRKTIARRKFHLDQVKSFQTGIYLKGVLRTREMPNKITGLMKEKEGKQAKAELGLDSTGKGVLYLSEQQADYYAQAPDKEKTYIRSVRQSGDPNGVGFERMPPVVTFYENNVNPIRGASPRGFISPISENALMYYKYKYEGEFRDGGYVIDKIKVTPRRLYEPLFTGTIYVVEDDWALQSVDLMVTKTANLEVFDTIHVRQTHLPLKKDTWVIKNQVLYPTIKFLGVDITGHFITVYDNQKINEPIPDSVFAGKIQSTYDKTANKKDTTYWTESRPIPLETDEVKDFVVKDSLRIVQSDPRYIDSIRREFNGIGLSDILVTGINYSTSLYKNKFYVNPLLSMRYPLVSYNTVEGVVVAPRVNWVHEVDTYNHLYGAVAARYGFSNTHFNAIGKFSYRKDNRAWHGRWWELGFEGGKYVFQFNPRSTLMPMYNTFTTLLYGDNYMKLYERWNGAIFFEKNHGNGFAWNVKLNYQKRLNLDNTTGYTFRESAETSLTSNLPAELNEFVWEEHTAAIARVGLSYKPGYTYTQFPDYKEGNPSGWPMFSVSYEKGIPNLLDSKVDFDKWRFGIEDRINMNMFGALSYNIAAGGFLNDKYVGLPDLMHLADNELIIAAPYLQSFQLAPYYKYSNTAPLYGELHVEYKLLGLLTNKIPLFRRLQWYLVAGNNTFFASEKNYYTEAFVGIDNIGFKLVRLLRVDVVRSWNSYNQPMTAIRLGLKMDGAVRVSTNERRGEW